MYSSKNRTANIEFWQSLFTANSVAVIGANTNIGSWGFNVLSTLKDLQKKTKDRRIYAVNPSRSEVLGLPSYKSILDIPEEVGLAIIVIPAEKVPQVLSDCAQKKVGATITISAGFAESDEAGERLELELIQIANNQVIKFVGPNCVGHADTYSSLASIGFASSMKPGPLAVISQSGTIGAYISTTASRMGLGISKFVSTGNEANQHLEDCLEYLAQDEHTRIIAAYIEGLREGRRFVQLAKEITARKPIIVLKAGGTKDSARAAKSHTGALTGSNAVYTAAFKQSGVIQVDDEEEICDLAMALLHQPFPKGNRIGILTIGGGLGVVATEVVEKEGLVMAKLEPASLDKLNAILPSRWSHGNPVDTAGIFNRPMDHASTVLSCLGILMEDANIDGVISLASPLVSTFGSNNNLNTEQINAIRHSNNNNMETLLSFIKRNHKPLIIYERAEPRSPEDESSTLSLFRKYGVPVYQNIHRAVRILRHLVWYRNYLQARNLSDT